MWYIAGACFLLVVSAAAGFTRSLRASEIKSAAEGAAISSTSIKALSRNQINDLISRLEKEESPEPVMGAMCYAPMMVPSVAEYICPTCGEKTLYSDSNTAFIEWTLDDCRRRAESINAITDFEILLDESLFCDFCSPEPGHEPYLVLRVVTETGEEVANAVQAVDLMRLESFLSGNLYFTTSNDGQMPLLEGAGRIRLLLGLVEE